MELELRPSLGQTLITAWETVSRGPGQAAPRLPAPRNHEIISMCCFKPLSRMVICYPERDD